MNKHYICSVNFDISCADESLQSRIVRCCPALRFYYHLVGVNYMTHYFRDMSHFQLFGISEQPLSLNFGIVIHAIGSHNGGMLAIEE